MCHLVLVFDGKTNWTAWFLGTSTAPLKSPSGTVIRSGPVIRSGQAQTPATETAQKGTVACLLQVCA